LTKEVLRRTPLNPRALRRSEFASARSPVPPGTGSRYSRQELFEGIGPEGQARIRKSRVLVVGCGALGSSLAEMMARAGVAELTIADRDDLEESNLQRQSLFDERDLAAGLPKAAAAEAKLRLINSDVRVTGLVTDVSTDNAAELVRAADLVLDGTDNFETRFLVNDVCVREGVPWVYGACVGSYGAALAVRPKTTPCLRCLLEEPPPPGSAPTCDTAGVVAPIVHVVAGIQAGEALKILAGRPESLLAGLVTVDVWAGTFSVLDLRGRSPWCPACAGESFDYAERASGGSAVLCGRDAVQVRPPRGASIDLPLLAGRLSAVGRVSANEHLVRFVGAEGEMVVFRDGRAIVKGVSDPARARSIYAKYVGS
jgi:adenylyltransferase/sulfurtransferase